MPFRLKQDSLEVHCNHIRLEDFTEVENLMHSGGRVGLLDSDAEEELFLDMKLLWDHVNSLGHLKEEQQMELMKVLCENIGTFKSEYNIGCIKKVKHSFVMSCDVPFN